MTTPSNRRYERVVTIREFETNCLRLRDEVRRGHAGRDAPCHNGPEDHRLGTAKPAAFAGRPCQANPAIGWAPLCV